MFKRVLYFAVICCLLLSSCSDESKKTGKINVFPLTTVESRAVLEHFDFSNKLLGAVLAETPEEENVIISPVGVSMALSMLANSDNQELAGEICDFLGADGLSTLNSLAKSIAEGMAGQDSQVDVALANSVWYHHKDKLKAGFKSAMDTYYGADYHAVDFSDMSTTQSQINDWVNEHTHGRIKSYPYAERNTYDMLVNALYFRGRWTTPYDKKETREEDFFGVSDTSAVQMMHSGSFDGVGHKTQDESCLMVEKTFGGSVVYNVCFVLPDPDYTTTQLVNEIKFYEQQTYPHNNIKLNIPKFAIEEQPKLNLSDVMRKLGVNLERGTSFFESETLLSHRLFQKCTVAFDEEGAVVSSVSSAEGGLTSPGWVPEDEVTLNRPFLFFISDIHGIVLLAGRISQL